ncbi:MAG: cytochrome c [Chloroflexi bacterium]|nr:cytochrome c [Chloroflexota bacterium]
MKRTTITKRWPITALAVAAAVVAGVSCLSPGEQTGVPVTTAPLPTPLRQTPLSSESPAARKTGPPTILPAETAAPTSVAAVAAVPPPSPIAADAKPDPQSGEKTFYAAGCIGCHTVQGIGGRIGPELTSIAATKDMDYIRESIKQPQAFIVPGYPAIMPSPAELGLSDQDIENIIAWLQNIR